MKLIKFFSLIVPFGLSTLTVTTTKNIPFNNEQLLSYSFQECFEKKVEEYIQKIQVCPLQSNSSHLALGKMILPTQRTKLKQIFVLLNHADKITEKYEPTKIALLLRASTLSWRYTYQILLDLLITIDDYLKYWQTVNNGSHYYFLQKPLKSFLKIIGCNHWIQNPDNANSNIQSLYLIQKHCFKELGELARQVQQFNTHATIDECYTWLRRFLLVMQSFSMQSQIVVIDNQKNIAKNMQQILKNISCYRAYIVSIIEKAKPPSHRWRSWARYALLMMSFYVVYKNRESISQWIDKRAKNIFHDYFILPMKNFYEIIINNKKSKKLTTTISSIEEKEKLIFQKKELLAKQKIQAEEYIENIEKRKNTTLKSIKKDLQQKEKIGLISTENREKIVYDLGQNDTNSFQQYVNDLPKEVRFSLKDFNVAAKVEAIQPTWNLAQFIFFNDGKKLLSDTRNMFNHALQGLITADEVLLLSRKNLTHYMDLLDKEVRIQQMTLRLTALMPAITLLWSTSKLASKFYAKFKKSNYSLMKKIVSRIRVLLFTCNGTMTSECYGKYLYLLHTLQHSADYIFQQNVKQELLHDIAILSSDNSNIKEKLFLIDGIPWKYNFFTPLYNV